MHHIKNPASGGTLDGANCKASRLGSPYNLNGGENIAPGPDPWQHRRGNHRRRLCSKREATLRAVMPYGVWMHRDGWIFFDRDYRQMFRRDFEGGPVTWLDPDVWVEGLRFQIWFFDDSNPPWFDKRTLKALQGYLHELFVGPCSLDTTRCPLIEALIWAGREDRS